MVLAGMKLPELLDYQRRILAESLKERFEVKKLILLAAVCVLFLSFAETSEARCGRRAKRAVRAAAKVATAPVRLVRRARGHAAKHGGNGQCANGACR